MTGRETSSLVRLATVRAAGCCVESFTDRYNERDLHPNLWIATVEAGRWGIQQRSR